MFGSRTRPSCASSGARESCSRATASRCDTSAFRARGARLPIASVVAFDVTEGARSWFTMRGNGTNGTHWHLRVLTRDGRAIHLFLTDDDVAHLRFIAARLNAILATIRMPQGYRDERALPPAA